MYKRLQTNAPAGFLLLISQLLATTADCAVIDFESPFSRPHGSAFIMDGLRFDPGVVMTTDPADPDPSNTFYNAYSLGAAISGIRYAGASSLNDPRIAVSLVGGGAFDFTGAWLSRYHFDAGSSGTIIAYKEGSLTPDYQVGIILPNSITTANPFGTQLTTVDHHAEWFQFDFLDVVLVELRSSGGGTIFMDDFTYDESSVFVPLPAALVLMCSSLASLGLLKRTRLVRGRRFQIDAL